MFFYLYHTVSDDKYFIALQMWEFAYFFYIWIKVILMILAFEGEDISFRYAMGKMKQSGGVLYNILSWNLGWTTQKYSHTIKAKEYSGTRC